MDFEATADATGVLRYVECAPDLWFPTLATVRGPAPGLDLPDDAEGSPRHYAVTATFALFPTALNYSLKSVQLNARMNDSQWEPGSGEAIVTDTYRSLRLAELQSGIGEALGRDSGALGPGLELVSAIFDGEYHEGTELYTASRIYARASLSGRRPQREVSEGMGISTATAGRWIRLMMKAGGLPGAEGLRPVTWSEDWVEEDDFRILFSKKDGSGDAQKN